MDLKRVVVSLMVVGTITVSSVAQEGDLPDTMKFRIINPENAPLTINFRDVPGTARFRVDVEHVSEKRIVREKYIVILFNIWREIQAAVVADSSDYKNDNAKTGRWIELPRLAGEGGRNYYYYAIPYKALFDDFTVWDINKAQIQGILEGIEEELSVEIDIDKVAYYIEAQLGVPEETFTDSLLRAFAEGMRR